MQRGTATVLATGLVTGLVAIGVDPAQAATGIVLGAGTGGLLAVLAAAIGLVLWRRARAELDSTRRRLGEAETRAAAHDAQLAARDAALETAKAAAEQSAAEIAKLIAERENVTDLLNSAPFAAWRRSRDLDIQWGNRCYRDIVGDATEIASAVDPDQPRRLARRAQDSGATERQKRNFVVDGERRTFEVVERPIVPNGDLAGFALDISELEEIRLDLDRHNVAHAEVLENLGTAIAIYGPDKRLMFFNRAYVRLWRLDEDFLNQAPTMAGVLDAQLVARRLPEQADFRAYKASRDALFTEVIEPREELIQLPDETMLRVLVTPHPFGGLLFLFEDVTDRMVLERAYNTLLAVERATLDNLYEGIAVFGSDGRLKLSNPVFARLWRLDEEALAKGPHAAEIFEQAEAAGVIDAGLKQRRDEVIASATSRKPRNGRLEREDGTVVDFATVPLPDGQTLFTYLDITDSLSVERALRDRNEALEAAETLMSEFLASVSYELRTPLNTIIGFTEILRNQYFGELNPRQLEYTDGVLDSSGLLLRLINDILDLASIEAGNLELAKSTVDITALLQDMMALSRERARHAGLELVLDCPADIGAVEADERRLKQVLFNVISNSFKFTPAKGSVRLSARAVDGGLELSVQDTGVGIAPEHLDRVFDKFNKGAGQGRVGGAGVGLALARSIIGMHGGHITLASAPGDGTKVSCYLPGPVGRVATAAEPAAEPAAVDSHAASAD